jgi:hypothetical protein
MAAVALATNLLLDNSGDSLQQSLRVGNTSPEAFVFDQPIQQLIDTKGERNGEARIYRRRAN